eukprot:m.420226 g.420226  ORF g.420226 m.420226 type:complete len:356 (+) comp20187_c0_seq13:907-1974(+)
MQDLTLLVVVRKRHGFRRQPRRERVLGFVWFGNARDNSFVSDRQHDYGILYDGHGKNHRDTGLDDAVGWLLVSAGGQSRHACRAPLHQSPPKTAAVHPGPRAAAKRNPTVVANNFDVVGGKLSVQRPRAALGCLCDIHFLGPVVPLSRDAWVCSLRPCSRCHCAGWRCHCRHCFYSIVSRQPKCCAVYFAANAPQQRETIWGCFGFHRGCLHLDFCHHLPDAFAGRAVGPSIPHQRRSRWRCLIAGYNPSPKPQEACCCRAQTHAVTKLHACPSPSGQYFACPHQQVPSKVTKRFQRCCRTLTLRHKRVCHAHKAAEADDPFDNASVNPPARQRLLRHDQCPLRRLRRSSTAPTH